jgi:L-malate glycosyltransferase
MTRKRILHCHSTFSLGGKEARAVRLMNVFGDRAEHVILSAVPEALGARDAIDPQVRVTFPTDAPPLHGKPSFGRYRQLSAYMREFDLVLTYNWGSMDAVGARRLLPRCCPPLIHHEDGFNQDEVQRLNWKRNAFRRLMLPAAHAVIVPSTRLEGIARDIWKQKAVIRIPNGIDVAAYALPCSGYAIPGFSKKQGDIVVGTLAGLRAVKNLPRLVRAVATLPAHIKLVIVGEGPEREAIRNEAARTGMSDRLLLPGFLPHPANYMGLFDVFALSSDSEQFPISLVEAMAAGLPAVCTDVGDVKSMVSDVNKDFILPCSDEVGFAKALATLVADADLRALLGASNRLRAVSDYDEKAMIARYSTLYGLN